VGLDSVRQLGSAYGRWIKEWHRYVWHGEAPHTEK